MHSFLILNEQWIRLGFFFGMLLFVALLEILSPRRPLTQSKGVRWVNNLGIVFLNTALLRVLLPITAAGLALWATHHQIGLLTWVDLPYGWKILIAVVVMDLVIYLQHVMVHALPLLWRLHRMHHADLDYDVTTGLRFHPLEIFLSMGIKFGTVLLLGAPMEAVILFEVILNATAMFNHGNIKLPAGLDRVLRLVLVTPDMHRVHHSVVPKESHQNFGFNLPWWDYCFGTYQAQPKAGQEGMTIGIPSFREPGELWLHKMLRQPFVSDSAAKDSLDSAENR